MWPFRRRKLPPLPSSIELDGVTATCSRRFDNQLSWSWTIGDLDFDMDCESPPSNWLALSRAAAELLSSIQPEIQAILTEHVSDWGDPFVAELTLTLICGAPAGDFDISAANLDKWGDFGVNIEVRDGRISDHWAGD